MSGDFLSGKKNPQENIDLPEIKQKCPYCQSDIEDDAEFCGKCGKFIRKEHRSSYTPMDEKKASKIRLIVGAVAVVIFLIIYFVVKK